MLLYHKIPFAAKLRLEKIREILNEFLFPCRNRVLPCSCEGKNERHNIFLRSQFS